MTAAAVPSLAAAQTLLSDPFLQKPTDDSITVVWFSDMPGDSHRVLWGEGLSRSVEADSTQLSRMFEDVKSRSLHPSFADVKSTVARSVWRHEAVVQDLSEEPTPYEIVSKFGYVTERRGPFSFSASPAAGKGLKILLTSDHQLKPLSPANLQKAHETIDRIHAVFLAGDLVNIPDRASEWFDDFPALQGKASFKYVHRDKTYIGCFQIVRA